jgi:acyl-CoA reductase-like NAD-dependent aldehyde dehydrogenase
MDAYRDEIFGPVLSVVRVTTYDEALGSSTRTRTATASRSSRATAASRGSSSST